MTYDAWRQEEAPMTDLKNGILAVDVGSGTQDILVWQPGIPMENCPKMIVPSATTTIGRLIDEATKKGQGIFLSGKTMGGGACAAAIRRHLKAGFKVYSLREPALTFHDALEKVRDLGIQIVGRKPDLGPLIKLRMGDIDLEIMRRALALFYVPFPSTVAVSVQDHGFSPKESNRAFRFRQWRDLLQSGNGLESLLYQDPPHHLTRMRAVSETVPGAWVMDTGASAILGALLDPWVAERRDDGVTVVNIGNEHTVAALIKGDKVWGIYEHHTSLLDPARLNAHLARFRREELTNQEVFDEMGHGCELISGAREASHFTHLSVTGPHRDRFASLQGHMAAPFGDMMLTGCFGLVEAVKRRIGYQGS
jgi:uncharacterized protein (DUF1786 family)